MRSLNVKYNAQKKTFHHPRNKRQNLQIQIKNTDAMMRETYRPDRCIICWTHKADRIKGTNPKTSMDTIESHPLLDGLFKTTCQHHN